jgi:putative nucleotidyltransferase with HDIG domain
MSAATAASAPAMRPASGAPRRGFQWPVAILTDNVAATRDIQEVLKSPFKTSVFAFDRFRDVDWADFDGFVIDAWRLFNDDASMVAGMAATLSHAHGPIGVIAGPDFLAALEATGLTSGIKPFGRPIVSSRLDQTFAGIFAGQTSRTAKTEATRRAFLSIPHLAEALTAADEALDCIFAMARQPGTLALDKLDRQSDVIIGSLAKSGMADWISGVRQHHDSTYQHCLLVVGAAIAFGQQLGFRADDMRRITLGALLHDVGKASIPLPILDKPSALSAVERGVIEKHPEFGAAMIDQQPALSAELREIVLGHHEMLDGSGYPEGKTGDQIPDVVRLISVADVYAALIERRAYKEPLSGEQAYDILLSKAGKLDMSIVRAIRPSAFTAQG